MQSAVHESPSYGQDFAQTAELKKSPSIGFGDKNSVTSVQTSLRCKRGALPVIPGAVDGVFTVVDTVVACRIFK